MSELAEDPRVSAERLGLVVVEPGANELFIDIDSDEDEAHYYEMLSVLRENEIPFDEHKRTVSKSGNTHIYLTIAPCKTRDVVMTDTQRIAFQAALGSDRKRELLSLLRLTLGTGRAPTLFFEKEAA